MEEITENVFSLAKEVRETLKSYSLNQDIDNRNSLRESVKELNEAILRSESF